MQRTAPICLAFLLGASVVLGADTNPLGKVIELLDNLAAKVTAEGVAEAKAYKEYFEWCDDVSKNTQFEIKTAKAKKEDLEAELGELAASIEGSTTKIEELSAAIASDESELKEATAVRDKEVADFQKAEAELVDTVDTLDRAVAILEREMAKNPAAFAQIDSTNTAMLAQALNSVIDAAAFTTIDKQKLTALVQSQQGSDDDDSEFGAPAAATYKTHSTNIVDVLVDMKDKAEEQLADLRKAEKSTAHNFAMLKQSLEDQVGADNHDLDQEKAAKSASEERQGAAEGDLSVTSKELTNAESELATASSNCMQTAADHEATVAARAEELKVIATATKIIKETVSGAVEQTYSLLQTRSRIQSRADLKNNEVVTKVKQLARTEHSAALAQLASRMDAVLRYGSANGDDVFAKIKGLISDMIAKLEKEADEDATEKAYCDEQMSKTEAKKADLDDTIARLTSKIDQASAQSAKRKEEVKELQQELAALSREQADMDSIRAEEHADYLKAKEELELGISGVQKALSVLRDYYGGAAAFVQQPAIPEKHEQATGAGQSIIGMLEVVESDFSENLAKEETQEADAQSQYDTTTQANKVTKTTKDQDVKYKTKEFTGLDKYVSDLSSDKATAGTEHGAVMEYYSSLKDRCVAKPETYEEQKRRRAAEIAGLKEALQVLEEETAFVQRKGRGLRGGVHLSP